MKAGIQPDGVCRDSEGNLAPLVQFHGDFTAWQAARRFAEMAEPEPRKARCPEGVWTAGDYSGTFRLVGGKRTYRMTCDRVYQSWRVYMLPQRRKGVPDGHS